MSVQKRADINNIAFILSGQPLTKDDETLLTDGARTAVLAPFTLLAKVSASGKLVPYTDKTATDGSAMPYGIYMGAEIAAALIAAGDVADLPVLVGGGVTVDREQVVIETGGALDDVVLPAGGATDPGQQTIEDLLRDKGIYLESTVDIDGQENT